MKRIALCQLPGMDLRAPSQGIAVLKSIAIQMGIEARCFDLNIKVWDRLVDSGLGHLWNDWSIDFAYALLDDQEFHKLQGTTFDREISNILLKEIYHQLDTVIDEYKPTVIGFSLFSIVQEITAKIVIKYIKEKYKNLEVIIGGPALRHYHKDSLPLDLLNLVDFYFVGDAEQSFTEYLKNNTNFGGINNLNVNMNFNRENYPSPDYQDFDFSLYPSDWRNPAKRSKGGGTIYLTGSKGCVRQCEFCDVPMIWPNFYQKEVKTVIRDIKNIREYYKFKNIFFTDSLINGSNKFIKDLSNEILNTFGGKEFTWGGQWICKSQKSLTEEYFKLCSEAGMTQIIVGIESGSEKIRWDMNKKFYNDDIYFTLEMCEKYNILFIPLMMCGYPTETEEDFEETLKLVEKFIEHRKVVRATCINMMMLLPGTTVTVNHDKYKIDNITYAEINTGYTPLDQSWSCGSNTYKTRIERFYRYQEKIFKNNIGLGHVKRKTLKRDYVALTSNPDPEFIKIIDFVDGYSK